MIIKDIRKNNAIKSKDKILIANTLPSNILSTWCILSDWNDKMVIAKQFRSIQSILPGISNEPTKDIQTAEDKSLSNCPRAIGKVMVNTTQ
ncbi:MAG TPA: hypothetical protein VKA98_00485 [Nitrososphaeraceae archaeon]|nr:hypothetical protein [Nitrososphaeraceae archaeon]